MHGGENTGVTIKQASLRRKFQEYINGAVNWVQLKSENKKPRNASQAFIECINIFFFEIKSM